MSSRFIVEAGAGFSFAATALSHGWRMLAPFDWDAERGSLAYTHQLADGRVVRLTMRALETGVEVALADDTLVDPELRDELGTVVRRMLNLDLDLSDFYAAMRGLPGYGGIARGGHGRMLRGGSIWEDLAKTLLTTNTSWANTVAMSRRLCQLGEPHGTLPDCHAFPTPRRIANMDYARFCDALRAGYRNAYLRELAESIASGALDLELWRELDSDGLVAAVKALKGFGDYAAGTMARMLGHFDKLAIDSVCRDMFARMHNGGSKADDSAIKQYYARYGNWQGLVMWLDIMNRGYV